MEKELDKFIKQLKMCDICKDKFGFDPHPIFCGNSQSKIVQISQAPSSTVHKTLKPFTDQSGKKLKYEWYEITDEVFYNPDNFCITSLAHCYPGKDKNGNDRLPPKICFEKWVKRELELIDNKLYVIIGAKAAKAFFPNENFSDLIFKNNKLNGKLAIVLPHPSPLNVKWFKDNPDFLNHRMKEIRKIVNNVLENKR
jgi:uracil-DNA glycosylase family 4